MATLLTTPIAAQVFTNGSHLVNLDNVAYTVRYTENAFSTRICWIKTPTKEIKNGLGSASMRGAIKGLEIKDTKPDGLNTRIEAVISPKTTVLCLSVDLLSLEIEGIGKIDSLRNKTVIVKDGKITIVDTEEYDPQR
jgi:hypothetical protein